MSRQIACNEVWGGIGLSDEDVSLAGMRGVCWSRPFEGDARGGDIHFLSVCGSNILSKAVLADVSGHGGAAAVAGEVLHHALVENMNEADNVGLLRATNTRLLEHQGDEVRFSTMVVTSFDARDGSLVYAYAGHPAILRRSDGAAAFQPLLPPSGPRGGVPVGVLTEVAYHEHRATLSQGDVLVLYSDAFTEARGADGSMLGEDGLARLLEQSADGSPRGLAEHVVSSVRDDLADDATLIVLEVA